MKFDHAEFADAISADASDLLANARVARGATKPTPRAVGSSRGKWFDPALGFREPEGSKFTSEILGILSSVEDRDRKRREIDQQNYNAAVRSILANGFRCHFYWRPCLVAYLRKADGYKNASDWLSGRALARAVDLLVAAELIDTRIGVRGDTASIYQINPRLSGIAEACGITADSLTLRLPLERLVRLREGNSKTDLIDFEPSDDTRLWTAQLDACNAFLAQQNIALAMSDREADLWVAHRTNEWAMDEDEPNLCRPEMFQTDLYRTFNNGSFEKGGRLYGGWWINTPKALRSQITINGQPTVELDFSGCAIRMLYHERGIEYLDDPYWLEDIAAHEAKNGLKPGHFREGIKAMTQAGINGTSGGQWERIPLSDGLSFRPAIKRLEVRDMIEKKHASIADAFGTGAGLRLQRKDSDLALVIVTQLMELGIAALPIHDSFLTSIDNRNILLNMMKECYRSMFKFDPIIK